MRKLLGLGILLFLGFISFVRADNIDESKPKSMTTQEISEALLDPKLFTFIGDQKANNAFILSSGAIYQWGKYEKFHISNERGVRCNLLEWSEFKEFMGRRLVVYISDASGLSSGRRVSYITNKQKWTAFLEKNKTKLIIILDVHTQEPAQSFYVSRS